MGAADDAELAPVSQRRMPPLSPAQATRLRQARALRANGQLEQARAALAPLLAEVTHHPAVVTEQARLLLARQDFAGAERLGRTERAAQRDSLMVARELALALERLGRPRDAAGVALESWLASPLDADWAQETVIRLAPADARGVRELLRRAAEARPGRADLVRAGAMLDWRAGDLAAALATLERAERPGTARAPLRWDFAQQLTSTGASRDSGAAVAALTALAGDGALRRDLAAHRGAARLDTAVRARRRGRGRARAGPGAPRRPHGALARRLPRGDRARVCARPAAPTRRARCCARAPRRPRRCPSSTSKRPSPTCATARPSARCRGSPRWPGSRPRARGATPRRSSSRGGATPR